MIQVGGVDISGIYIAVSIDGVSQQWENGKTITSTTPITISGIRSANKTYNARDVQTIKIYINEGSKAFPDTTNIYLNEPLTRMGTYIDYIDFKNQKVVRNNGFIDMSKLSWSYNTSYLSSGLFTTTPTNKLSGQTNVISEVYQTGPQFQSFSQMRNKAIAGYSSGSNRNVAVRDDDYNASTLNDFKNSLKGKYMCYQLETPTQETIDVPRILTTTGDCVIDIDTKVKPSKLWLKYIKR